MRMRALHHVRPLVPHRGLHVRDPVCAATHGRDQGVSGLAKEAGFLCRPKVQMPGFLQGRDVRFSVVHASR